MIKRTISFVIFLLLCAAFFFYYWSGGLIANSPTDMLAAAAGFLEDVGGGRVENAYAHTSASFRKEHTPEQFREILDKYPLLKSRPKRQVEGYTTKAPWTHGSATYDVTLLVGKESLPVQLQLVTEEAVWKVDNLTVRTR